MLLPTNTLRSKILTMLTLVVATYALADYALRQSTFPAMFEGVENDDAKRNMDRVRGVIHAELDALEQQARWLGHSMTAVDLVRGESPTSSNSTDSPRELPYWYGDALELLDLDILVFTNAKGKVCWSAIKDDHDLTELQVPRTAYEALDRWAFSEQPGQEQASRSAGIASTSVQSYVLNNLTGIRNTPIGPVLMTAGKVTINSSSSEVAGVVVVGRIMDDEYQQLIAARSHMNFRVRSIDSAGPQVADAEVLEQVTASVEPVVQEVDKDTLYVYAGLEDINRRPTFLACLALDRKISRGGAAALNYATNSTLAFAFILLLALIYLLQRTVVSPLSFLTRHAVAIGSTEDLTARIHMEREDEIGVLASEFDEMVEKLALAQRALVDAARSAGMSDIATGILHNVGNVLNSVNVSASLLNDQVEGMGIDTLGRVVKVLDKHKEDMEHFVTSTKQGSQIYPVLNTVYESLEEERASIYEEVTTLAQGIEHIRELIVSQQAYAGRSIVDGAVLLQDELESALRLSGQAHPDGQQLEIEREYEDLPEIETDKHKVLEILVNLIQNARQAMVEADGPGLLHLSLKQVDDRVQIRIKDSGIGVPVGDLTRIFAMGYTTKVDGTGFGLHTCGNAATELGGSVTAFSEGPGTGATFVLDLPYRLPRKAMVEAA